MSPFLVLSQMLDARLGSSARAWLKQSTAEISNGLEHKRFSLLLSLASRHAKDKQPLAPSEQELQAANKTVEGWNPERWTLLEALRVRLVLCRTDLGEETGALAIEDAFAYADEGEQRALYRSLALVQRPERFLWRAGEGCRSNMQRVFEAMLLDSPYATRCFDSVAFDQAVIKCVFMGAPLWRLWGLDTRLSEELCHMALDLVDERRSAGREVQGELWLCLGTFLPERALLALEAEFQGSNPNQYGLILAIHGLLRAGHGERARALGQEPRFCTPGKLKDGFDAALGGVSVYDFCRSYHR